MEYQYTDQAKLKAQPSMASMMRTSDNTLQIIHAADTC